MLWWRWWWWFALHFTGHKMKDQKKKVFTTEKKRILFALTNSKHDDLTMQSNLFCRVSLFDMKTILNMCPKKGCKYQSLWEKIVSKSEPLLEKRTIYFLRWLYFLFRDRHTCCVHVLLPGDSYMGLLLLCYFLSLHIIIVSLQGKKLSFFSAV